MSRPGNLYASVLLRLLPDDGPPAQLSFVAALALAEAVGHWVSPDLLRLKWPNDLLLDGRKLSGILIEREGNALITGFGVNLVDHPTDSERPATSLAAHGIAPPSPDLMLAELAESWATWLVRWRGQGFSTIRHSWMARAHPLGEQLLARLANGETVEGRYDGLDAHGGLLLRLTDGKSRAIHAADVFAV